VILEAWGPDLASCAEEAVAALVNTFAVSHPSPVAQREVHLSAASAEALLLEVLEEVIFTLDTAEAVPVGAKVATAADGGLDVVLLLAARADVEPTGGVPKAISRSELEVVVEPSGAHGRFLVDV
jgi:SHS2 domain-containing protein